MAWLWSSWQEYLDYVQPVAVNSRGLFGMAQRGSWFETERHLYDAVHELSDALQSLRELGFTASDHKLPPGDPSIVAEARGLVIELVHAGEELLLYNKRLATSMAAYGFLHQHDLLKDWENYSGTGRISKEIDELVEDTQELLAGYHKLTNADESFLVDGLDLPSGLESDFRLARNLFSIGFDEVGVLIAGRGLEGVLRKAAQVRRIMIEVRGRLEPASDADVYDLIEAMFRLRWKTKGTRLITAETRALLHYLRALRNQSAHADTHGRRSTVGPREMATIVADTANRLWKEITATRAKLDRTTLQKTW